MGFKNVMITNNMSVGIPKQGGGANCVHASEVPQFLNHKSNAFYLWVVFHEFFGHGTGKLLAKDAAWSFNFNAQNPPINPLTEKPIWCCQDQMWTGLFGDIATSVDKCRAGCVGAYLTSDMKLLAFFGFLDETEIEGRDCEFFPLTSMLLVCAHAILVEYNIYMQLGCCWLLRLGKLHSRRSCESKTCCIQQMIPSLTRDPEMGPSPYQSI